MTGFSLYLNNIAGHAILSFGIPAGIGYVEWICNIPDGFSFVSLEFYYIVQLGSSSACLGKLNTTYPLLTYSTRDFASFTQSVTGIASLFVSTLSPPTTTRTLPTTSFPTGTFGTITLNPNLVVASTTSSSLSSSSSPSSSSPSSSTTSSLVTLSPTPSPKPNSGSVAGGVVGAVAFVLLIVALVLWRRSRSSVQRASSPIVSRPTAVSRLATGELGPTDPSSPFRFSGRFSGAEFLGGTPQYPFSPPDPYSHGTEPTSDNLIVVPVTGNPAALVDPVVSQRPSQGTITPFYAEPALPSQRPRKPRNYGCQASQPQTSPDLPSRTPPTVEQQPPYTQSSDTPAPETSRPDAVPLPQQPSTRETQEGPLGFTDVLGVISRAQLSETERLATVRNLLVSDSSGRPDLARQNTVSSPPPYTE